MPIVKLYKPGQHLIATVFNYAMLMLFAATLAYWFWVFFKPASLPLPPPSESPEQTLLPAVHASNWFGMPTSLQVNGASAETFRLVGIISAKRRSSAIFQFANGKQKLISLSQEISPGVSLVAVKKDEVTIKQNGEESSLKLERTPANPAIGLAGSSR